jgi:hypothetical protein
MLLARSDAVIDSPSFFKPISLCKMHMAKAFQLGARPENKSLSGISSGMPSE